MGLMLDTSAGLYQTRTLSHKDLPPHQLLTLLLGQDTTCSASAVCAQLLYRAPAIPAQREKMAVLLPCCCLAAFGKVQRSSPHCPTPRPWQAAGS